MSKDNVKDLPEVGKLTKAQIGDIITLFVECEGKIELVRQDFHRLYGRRISVATLKQILAKYQAKIFQKEKEMRESGLVLPLARANFRFKMLYRIFIDAGKVKHRGWEKVNSEQVQKKMCWDEKTMIACLRLSHQMDMDLQQKEIDRARLALQGSLNADFNASGDNSGTEDDEHAATGTDDIDDGVRF